MRVGHVCCLVLVSILALLTVAPVTARAPEPVPYQTAVIRNVRSVTCPGYNVDITTRIDVERALTYFDQAGNPLRTQAHSVLNVTLRNSVSGATRSLAQVAQTIVIDRTTNTETTRGLRFKLTVPGQGTVILDAGLMKLDPANGIMFHGPHAFADSGRQAQDVICPALPTQ